MTKPPTGSHITAASGAKHTIAPGSEHQIAEITSKRDQRGHILCQFTIW